jgi:ABC-2 type transport system permease protein
MFTDIVTIVWKEIREIVVQRPGLRGGWVGLAVLLGVFGILIPLQNGPEWIQSPINMIIWAWVPYLLVSGVVADSFAGERERHTLETLLASRLPDSAILFGKIAASLLYGWGLTVVSVLLSLITINVAHWQGYIQLFPPGIAAGVIGISFLVALFAAGLGVLVSLRAGSVRQAQQAFSLIFLVFFIPLFLLPLLPPEIQSRVTEAVAAADSTTLALGAAALLVTLDLVLLLAARARFQRARLILD